MTHTDHYSEDVRASQEAFEQWFHQLSGARQRPPIWHCDLDPKKWRPQTWVGKQTQILKSRMSPLAVVKGFDGLKDAPPGLGSCLKGLLFNALPSETMEATFHPGIIVAIGRAAHADNHPLLSQEGLIALAGVGPAPITVGQ